MLSKKESQGVFIVSFTKHLKNSHTLFQEIEEEMFMPLFHLCDLDSKFRRGDHK